MIKHPGMHFAAGFLALTLARVAAAANGADQDICAAASPWQGAHAADLRLQWSEPRDYMRWTFTFASDQDLLIETESREGDEVERGKIMLVGGRAMLTQGLELEPQYAIDAMDSPILMYDLVISLLDQAIPEGPEHLLGERSVAITETNRAIRVATPSASGRYEAPWTASGTIRRADAVTVAYSMSFTFDVEDQPQTIMLDGTWRKGAQAPVLDEHMNIEGWTLYGLGAKAIRQENATIFDYGADASPVLIRTLGELQGAIERAERSADR